MTDHTGNSVPASSHAELEARVAELERLAAEARRQLTEWQARMADPPPGPDPEAVGAAPATGSQGEGAVERVEEPTTGSGPTPLGRRRALQAMGGAAVAGAASLVASAPAAAADGDAVTIGLNRTAQSTTMITATQAMAPVLHVRATNVTFSMIAAAVQGSTAQAYGYGVVGLSTTSSNGVGVLGQASGDLGSGVVGLANGTRGRGGVFDGTVANLSLIPSGANPTTRANVREGDLAVSAANELWMCVGTVPSVWRLLAGPTTSNAIRLVTPYRAYDSRPGEPPASGVKARITNGEEREVSLASGANPPAGSTGALVNLTATATSAAGWLSIFRGGTAWPGTSTVNWSQAGSSIANFAVVAMTPAGGVKVRAAGSADVIIDVIGFI